MYLVNYLDDYDAVTDTDELDSAAEASAAIKQALDSGNYSTRQIQLFQKVDFEINIAVNIF